MENHKYAISKKFDLSFLEDVYMNIGSGLKYTNNIQY
jgi:hypothetical protein